MRCVGRKMSHMLGVKCPWTFQVDVSLNLEIEMCGGSSRKDRDHESE